MIMKELIRITTKKHMTGSKMANTVIRVDPKSSPVERRKFAMPPVVPVDVARNAIVPAWTTSDTPPPAMIARGHL
jgi:hypothetical protein